MGIQRGDYLLTPAPRWGGPPPAPARWAEVDGDESAITGTTAAAFRPL